MVMMAVTTSSSISVKPSRPGRPAWSMAEETSISVHPSLEYNCRTARCRGKDRSELTRFSERRQQVERFFRADSCIVGAPSEIRCPLASTGGFSMARRGACYGGSWRGVPLEAQRASPLWTGPRASVPRVWSYRHSINRVPRTDLFSSFCGFRLIGLGLAPFSAAGGCG